MNLQIKRLFFQRKSFTNTLFVLWQWVKLFSEAVFNFLPPLFGHTRRNVLGPHFQCWVLGVVLFNTWLISSWEKITVVTSWATDKMTVFYSKWQLRPFWVKYMSFCAFAQLVTTFIFFSAWDKSHVKRHNSQNSAQKMRSCMSFCQKPFFFTSL